MTKKELIDKLKDYDNIKIIGTSGNQEGDWDYYNLDTVKEIEVKEGDYRSISLNPGKYILIE